MSVYNFAPTPTNGNGSSNGPSSKAPAPTSSVPRKKSCIACRKSKTRCSLTFPKCTRCAQKNIECSYDGSSVQEAAQFVASMPETGVPNPGMTPIAEDLPEWTPETMQIDETHLALAYPGSEILDTSFHRFLEARMDTSLMFLPEDLSLYLQTGTLPVSGMNVGDRWLGNFDLQFSNTTKPLPRMADFQLRDPASNVISLSHTPWAPHALPDPGIRSFGRRSTVSVMAGLKHDHVLNEIKKYPKMLRTFDNLPPFIHPILAFVKQDNTAPYPLPPPQLTTQLQTCLSVIDLFYGHASNRKLLWSAVRSEVQRLHNTHMAMELPQLVEGIQVLVIYTLLRLEDGPTEHNNFDVSLLDALGRSCIRYLATVFNRSDMTYQYLHEEASLSWQDWALHESFFRCIHLIYLVYLIVDISPVVARQPPQVPELHGFDMCMLICGGKVWEGKTWDTWVAEHQQELERRNSYGLKLRIGLLSEFSSLEPPASQSAMTSQALQDWVKHADEFGRMILMVDRRDGNLRNFGIMVP